MQKLAANRPFLALVDRTGTNAGLQNMFSITRKTISISTLTRPLCDRICVKSLPHHTACKRKVPVSQHTHSLKFRPYSRDSESEDKQKLMLMDLPVRVFPNPLNIWKASFDEKRLQKFDSTFTQDSFLEGADFAVETVSRHLAAGQFDQLTGLVDEEALEVIQENHAKLDLSQKRELVISRPIKVYMRFINSIKLCSINDERCAVIWTVYHKCPQLEEAFEAENRPTFNQAQQIGLNFTIANFWFKKPLANAAEEDWTVWLLNYATMREKWNF